MTDLDPGKCVICGYRKLPVEVDSIPYPLCSHCNSKEFSNMLWATLKEVEEDIAKSETIDCEHNPLFSFIADLGMLGTAHHFLNRFKDMIALMARQVATEGKIIFSELLHRISCKNILARVHLLRSFLDLLVDTNLITIKERIVDGKIAKRYEVEKDSLLMKISATAEEESLLQRAATFGFGYATLRGIEITINSAKSKGKLTLEDRDGILKLYPKTKFGQLLVLKEFTAPLVYIFSMWAKGKDQFSEYELISFLNVRGVSGKRFDRIKNRLISVLPGTFHKLVTYETVYLERVPTVRFNINLEYVRLRDSRIRLRARLRERA